MKFRCSVHSVSMSTCPSCQHPATKRDGYDATGRQRYHCRPCQRDFTAHSISVFSGYRWPPDVILMAVRWYCSLPLSAAQVVRLLAERHIDVTARTVLNWVQTFGPSWPPHSVSADGGSGSTGRWTKCSAFGASRNSIYTGQSTSTGRSLMCCCVTNAIGPVRKPSFDRP